MLSIIIPTLNEEKFLPLLLDSIKKQDFGGESEIIVADAGSEDKTIEIAKIYNCKIIKGGLPAKGRNEGAKVAIGGLLLFLDADITLPEKFFEKALRKFKERNLDVASFCLEAQAKRKIKKFLFNVFYNWPILVLEKILPHGSQAILVKKTLHEKIGGFDEEIRFAEDHSYVRKAKKMGNFGILHSVKALSSLRRFEKDGWILTYLKYIFAEIYMIIFGDIKRDIFNYRFDHYRDGNF
ncbi:glycosyltransferase [Patescibacteria group bacterium]|nr:glycosyltransferase [Patescibacteria group bacterium]